MDHSSPCSSHDAAGYSSLLLLLVEAEVTKQSSNGPDNFYPVGEDLVLFDLGTSIGAANCNVNESGKSHTGKREEVDLPLFSFASVSAATDTFSNANKLGKGGFGPVYKIQ